LAAAERACEPNFGRSRSGSWRPRHDGIDGQGKWLAQVLRGWMAYYAVPMSGSAISAFRHHMIERWHGILMRRSQRRRLTWIRMKTIADRLSLW
jgi:RNA-directed DNA polymerase